MPGNVDVFQVFSAQMLFAVFHAMQAHTCSFDIYNLQHFFGLHCRKALILTVFCLNATTWQCRRFDNLKEAHHCPCCFIEAIFAAQGFDPKEFLFADVDYKMVVRMAGAIG